MQGRLSYRTGVRRWLDSDRTAAMAAFQDGLTSADQCYRSLCQGFMHFLTADDGEGLSATLREFANADLAGGSDFSMLFVVGYAAWKLTESESITDEATRAVLLFLAQRSLYAVQVEMPRPLLQSLERQYELVLAHLTDLLDYQLRQMRHRSVLVDTLLDRLSYPDCNLSSLVRELGIEQATEHLCLMDRLLVAGAFLARRLAAGEPTDLAGMLAAT